jgi:hypothetical protein
MKPPEDPKATFAQRVHERMLELEKRHGDDHANIDVVAARIVGVEFGEDFEDAVAREVGRALLLAAGWYGVRVAVLPSDRATAVAFIQGVTFAKAIEELLHAGSSSPGVPG